MVRGDPVDQERTIAKAFEAGVNYFDTAVQYGDGASERNLGRVLKSLKADNVIIGTKVRFLGRAGQRRYPWGSVESERLVFWLAFQLISLLPFVYLHPSPTMDQPCDWRTLG